MKLRLEVSASFFAVQMQRGHQHLERKSFTKANTVIAPAVMTAIPISKKNLWKRETCNLFFAVAENNKFAHRPAKCKQLRWNWEAQIGKSVTEVFSEPSLTYNVKTINCFR